jgi:hypothetical protein
MLAEFAELCLGSARDLHARQLAAENVAEAAALAGALHKVGRSLRQSMALEAKLRRDEETARHEVEAAAVRGVEDRRERRRTQVSAMVERIIWDETEDEWLAEGRIAELSDHLDAETLADGFDVKPLEAVVARLLDRLGLRRGVPEPAGQAADAPADPAWRSSA